MSQGPTEADAVLYRGGRTSPDCYPIREEQTRFEVTTEAEVVCYGVRYDGLDETAEPGLVVVD